jgi:hypothetical protein
LPPAGTADWHFLQPKARHRVVLALVALEWLPEAELE